MLFNQDLRRLTLNIHQSELKMYKGCGCTLFYAFLSGCPCLSLITHRLNQQWSHVQMITCYIMYELNLMSSDIPCVHLTPYAYYTVKPLVGNNALVSTCADLEVGKGNLIVPNLLPLLCCCCFFSFSHLNFVNF